MEKLFLAFVAAVLLVIGVVTSKKALLDPEYFLGPFVGLIFAGFLTGVSLYCLHTVWLGWRTASRTQTKRPPS